MKLQKKRCICLITWFIFGLVLMGCGAEGLLPHTTSSVGTTAAVTSISAATETVRIPTSLSAIPTATISVKPTHLVEVTSKYCKPGTLSKDDKLIFYRQAADLTRGQVVDIKQAPDGAMWFLAGGGLARFKNDSWTAYPIDELYHITPSTRMSITQDGDLWIGSHQGVFRYNGKSWAQFTQRDGLADSDILQLAASVDGVVWASTPHGVSRYDGKSWVTYPSILSGTEDRVTVIAPDPYGGAWFSLKSGLLIHFDGKRWTSDTYGATILSMVLGPDGSVWLFVDYSKGAGPEYKLVQVKDGEVFTYRHKVFDSALVVDLVMTKDNTLLLPLYGGKYPVIQFDGLKWTTLCGDDLEQGYYIDKLGLLLSLYEDQAGTLWFGTTRGAYHLVP